MFRKLFTKFLDIFTLDQTKKTINNATKKHESKNSFKLFLFHLLCFSQTIICANCKHLPQETQRDHKLYLTNASNEITTQREEKK